MQSRLFVLWTTSKQKQQQQKSLFKIWISALKFKHIRLLNNKNHGLSPSGGHHSLLLTRVSKRLLYGTDRSAIWRWLERHLTVLYIDEIVASFVVVQPNHLNSHSSHRIFWYCQSLFCLPLRPRYSDFSDVCLHWVSVVRASGQSYQGGKNFLHTFAIPSSSHHEKWCQKLGYFNALESHRFLPFECPNWNLHLTYTLIIDSKQQSALAFTWLTYYLRKVCVT